MLSREMASFAGFQVPTEAFVAVENRLKKPSIFLRETVENGISHHLHGEIIRKASMLVKGGPNGGQQRNSRAKW